MATGTTVRRQDFREAITERVRVLVGRLGLSSVWDRHQETDTLSEAKHGAHCEFSLRDTLALQAEGTSGSANKTYDFRVHQYRQPLRLHFEANMSRGEKLDSSSNAKGKTCKAVASGIRETRRSDTGHHKGSNPRPPLFKSVFMGEIAMKLVQRNVHAGWHDDCSFYMRMRVLSGPAEFDEIVLIESYAKSRTAAGTGIEDDPRRHSFDPRLGGETGAGSVPHYRGEVETKQFRLGLRLGESGTRRPDEGEYDRIRT